ncbi:hypothetical protein [Domibacillus indicus]|uniref:hypothetical protein n=1 Tax=Domibacillus indicus TaxID=1437523 RepID=UPI00061829EF|nr:hypothetical protein [Domibacillus indicus]
MDVGIAYFPKHYISDKPDAGGHFPFAIEGTVNYIFDIDNVYPFECDGNFVLAWMKSIKAYPVFFCFEVPSSSKQEYEKNCAKTSVPCHYLFESRQLAVAVTEIQTEKQFQDIFPWLSAIWSINETILWSANKNVFSVEQREWTGSWEGKVTNTVVVEAGQDTSVFWIGYGGTSIVVLSNKPQFSTYEYICGTLPGFVHPALWTYDNPV